MKSQYYNAFVGGASGVFKGICALEKKDIIVKNLDSLKGATNKNPINVLSWADKTEEEILIGYGNQTIKVYNVATGSIHIVDDKKWGDGGIVGLSKYKGSLLAAIDSGVIKCWREGSEPNLIQVNGSIEKMKHGPNYNNLVATGGKENDLKLWDLETGKQTFAAKNVRHDSLDMRVPVWVSDIAFIPETQKVAVTSKHGHVRLYDPSSSMRRPVVSVQIPEQTLTCIAVAPVKPQHVVVGSGTGQMNLVDLRGAGVIMNKYKGFLGAVKCISCPEDEPYIASVSLDRHFRIHHFSTKELIFKEYMQSKLTTVLVRRGLDLLEPRAESGEEEEEEETRDVEYEELFQNMPTIGDKRTKSPGGPRKKHKS